MGHRFNTLFAGTAGGSLLLFFILMWALAVIGWIKNILKIFGLWDDPVTAELVIRIIGVPIAIIGAFAGWF